MDRKSKIENLIVSCARNVRAFGQQGYQQLTFNALLYKAGKRLNGIEKADAKKFRRLVRTYINSEDPDKIKVEFFDGIKGTLIWTKTYDLGLEDSQQLIVQAPVPSLAGLGEVEINDLVNRKFQELERSRELERMTEELRVQKELNDELNFRLSEAEASLEAKKNVEYYSNIIGMALPGLAKLFGSSPVGSALNFLSGAPTEEEPNKLEAGEQPTDQRESILGLIGEFARTLTNQELGTLYLLFIELEKDRNNISKILHLITQNELSRENN